MDKTYKIALASKFPKSYTTVYKKRQTIYLNGLNGMVHFPPPAPLISSDNLAF